MEPETGFGFGQSEPLTTRLRNLIRDYPKGIGIINEFVQNADDSGASCLDIVLDRRNHPMGNLPDADMRVLQGPALLFANDRPFTPEDIANIQNIGDSGKAKESSKTGRFGLGFNASYNVTDHPMLLTGDALRIFDPHKSAVPQAKNGHSNGGGWRLDELWEQYPGVLLPFVSIHGFSKDQRSYDRTIFRLPLRTLDLAQESKISPEPFALDDFYNIVGQLRDSGGELLIFLKHLMMITVTEITDDLGSTNLLTIATMNAPEVANAKSSVNRFINGDQANLLSRLEQEPERLPSATYRHQVRVTTSDIDSSRTWRVVSGIYLDPAGQLLSAAREMNRIDEKAIPLAGAAIELNSDGYAIPKSGSAGRIYCSLPLPERLELAIHINGFFDLDSGRHALTSGEGLVGGSSNRVAWNQLLVTHAVAQAYAYLIRSLIEFEEYTSAHDIYSIWPRCELNLSEPISELPGATYRYLADMPVIRAAGDEEWTAIADVLVPPPDLDYVVDLHAALVAERFAIPDPQLPRHIREGLTAVSAQVNFLPPSYVRDQFRMNTDVDTLLVDAPRPALQKREWVVALLRICLSDEGPADLKGLPFALRTDGKLHTFGFPVQQTVFISQSNEHELFADFPERFVDPDFARESQLTASPTANLNDIELSDVIGFLEEILASDSGACRVSWCPDNPTTPNSNWLTQVFDYLARSSRNTGTLKPGVLSELQSVPLVPNQFSELCRLGQFSTPLLPPVDYPRMVALTQGLTEMNISLVDGSAELTSAIRAFGALNDDLVKKLEWEHLIAALYETHGKDQGLPPEYDSRTHNPVLDYLSASLPEVKDQDDSYDVIRSRLAALPMFPTVNDELASVQDDHVFLPSDFRPPQIGGQFALLRTQGGVSWRNMLRALDAKELTGLSYVERILLPSYDGLSPSDQYNALSWIRDNFDQIETAIVSAQGDTEAFKKLIADSRLVLCTDGETYALTQIFNPSNEGEVRSILGDNAIFPDMEFYAKNPGQWIDFFGRLGMSSQPRPTDILIAINILRDQATDVGVEAVRAQIRRIFFYVDKHWESLTRDSEQAVWTGGETFAECLRGWRWIPASADSSLPGFRMPRERLFRPSELELPRNGRLVASQWPIADLPEPRREVREQLNMRGEPEISTVMAHFDFLLYMWSVAKDNDTPTRDIEQSLDAVYQYFGRQVVDQNDREMIRDYYAETKCLFGSGRFWRPSHFFSSPVPYLMERRHGERRQSIEIDRGYTTLGRREAPDVSDLCSFLSELYSDFQGKPLPESMIPPVLEVHRLLCIALHEEEGSLENVYLLTELEQLAPCSTVYIGDAPWYDEAIREGTESVHLLHPKIDRHKIERHTQVKRLSDSIQEHLQHVPSPATDEVVVQFWADVQNRLRSQEFQYGFVRLFYHEHRELPGERVDWLKHVVVTPVAKITTRLTLDRGNGAQYLGQFNAPYYLDSNSSQIFLMYQAEEDMFYFLTNVLNRALDDRPVDRLCLNRILKTSGSQIREVLDHLRVTEYQEVAEVYEWDYSSAASALDPDSFWNTEPNRMEGEVASSEEAFDAVVSVDQTDAFDDTIIDPVDDFADVDDLVDHGHLNSNTGMKSKSLEPSSQSSSSSASRDHGLPAKSTAQASITQRSMDPASSVLPPTRPTDSRTRKATVGEPVLAKKREHLISYVRQEHQVPQVDPADDERAENLEIGNAAEDLVLQYEIEEGRLAEKRPHNNPGFDIYSKDNDHERYIEVKGVDGPWTEVGVPLSPTQIMFGTKHGEAYWLYVVEHARDADRSRIHPIQDPVGRIVQYRVDNGWIAVAEGKSAGTEKPLIPIVGMLVKRQADGTSREIVEVNQQGSFFRLRVRTENGDETLIFQPGTMELQSPLADD